MLDNCEHVVHGAAQCVATILQRCENVRVLATSREALRIGGERVYAVTPQALPASGSVPTAVLASAGELFATRAGSVQPNFVVTAQNAAAVTSICRRLDGLPLAIELAAARARMLSLQQIDDRLADAVGLLLACAAAVSGARYTDAARYSSLALDAPTAAAA